MKDPTLPEKPTREVLRSMRGLNISQGAIDLYALDSVFESLIQIARDGQRKYGYDLIPPVVEDELAYASYFLLRRLLTKQQFGEE